MQHPVREFSMTRHKLYFTIRSLIRTSDVSLNLIIFNHIDKFNLDLSKPVILLYGAI